MFKRLKTVSMMLFLLGASTGAAFAVTPSGADDVKIAQQSGTATGTVVDEFGPVTGAAVVVKGTTNGVVTDFDGNFSLANVKKGDILEISFVGYATQTVKWEGQPLNITLKEDAEIMEEVVVLGYGVTQKRGKLTNSVSKVKQETLSVGSYGDPAQALAGAVSGVKIKQTSGFAGSTPSITLRGGTSYDGAGSPLVIVDGQIRTDGLSDLNSNDIESMEVMKDAGATAIYGARAANGVILVTTKSGKKGSSQVNFNMKVGQQHYVAPYDMMDAYGYIYWIRKATAETPWCTATGGLTAGNTAFGTGATELSATSTYNVLGYTGSEYQQNLINNHGWKVMDDPVGTGQIMYKDSKVTDYNVNSPAWSQEYNLSFSGGNDRGKYYAGLGYYDAEGLPTSSFYKRYSFSFNGSYKINDWLESSSIFSYNRANWLSSPARSQGDSYFFGRVISLPSTIRMEDEEGNPLLGASYNDGNYNYEVDQFIREYQTDKFNMTQSLEATLFKGFKLKGTMAWSYSEYLGEAMDKLYHKGVNNTQPQTGYSMSGQFYRYFNQTYNVVATYNETFGDHSVSAMAGMEYWDKQYKMLSASGSGAPSDDFMDLGYTSTDQGKRSVNSEHNQERILSYFGRAQYDYKGKYIAAFTFRQDGYSRLINNRWGFFPGVSAGWVASEESFYEPLKEYINYAKIRASYGVNGSIDGNYIGIYTLHGSYSASTYNGNVGYNYSSLANPSLRWEKTRTAEIGFDLGFLQDKYTLGFTFYDRVTEDKYASLPLPPTTGWSSVTNNNGKFRNRGIEVDVNANLLRTKDFTWKLSANIAYNKNTIVELPENGLDKNRQGGTEIYTGNGDETHFVGGYQEGLTPNNVIVGHVTHKMMRRQEDLDALAAEGYADKSQSIGVYYGEKGLKKLRDSGFNGTARELALGDLTFKDINGDGMITAMDRQVIGTQTPKWNGGFNTTATWKGLTLYLRTDFGLGFTSYDGFKQWMDGCGQGAYNMTTDIWDSWTPENPNAKYPRYVWADQNGKNNYIRTSDFWTSKGNYLAFREVQLSYTLPKAICNKFSCQSLTLSATAQNLGYWTSSENAIPDYTQYTNGNVGGWGGVYPLPRTFLFGLNVTF